MSKSQKVFRFLWRVNAILILVAAGAITFGAGTLLMGQVGASVARRREAESGPLAKGATTDPRLLLGQVSAVPGSSYMRADLVLPRDGEGFSGGGYTETRNVLFIDSAEKGARWLLPDDKHIIVGSFDVMTNEDQSKSKRMVATVALVKTSDSDRQTGKGRLLLFGPSGSPIVEVADGVRALHIAGLSGEQIHVLYERDGQLVVALFAAASLAKQREQAMTVPALK